MCGVPVVQEVAGAALLKLGRLYYWCRWVHRQRQWHVNKRFTTCVTAETQPAAPSGQLISSWVPQVPH